MLWRNFGEEAEAKGRAEGRAEGKAEGKAEGEYQKALSMAKAMLSDGEPIEKIVKYSGLSESEIIELKNKNY